jgi:hypothetical protein
MYSLRQYIIYLGNAFDLYVSNFHTILNLGRLEGFSGFPLFNP